MPIGDFTNFDPFPREIRDPIRQLSGENPLWGAPRVQGELPMLGLVTSQTTIAKTMIRHRKPLRIGIVVTAGGHR